MVQKERNYISINNITENNSYLIQNPNELNSKVVQEMLYVCPFCLRTLKWPCISTSSPNLTCGPHFALNGEEFYATMTLAAFQKELEKARE